ncbi:hypothetical protein C922_02027 [Plasmodium inui San Antonio 1]|uniref:Uncharacterized protein n=1 Tax=Plasmodium inui San Antonio 1 TaxID=1237626 RepID=W7A995_9APIC|nr:hypothetical protein C922_02027 [Plasmodium inui San Antonio 1]EUD67838.1 hypothetical protein C922_02027 [Plasmodium inui San Antonio 1]
MIDEIPGKDIDVLLDSDHLDDHFGLLKYHDEFDIQNETDCTWLQNSLKNTFLADPSRAIIIIVHFMIHMLMITWKNF